MFCNLWQSRAHPREIMTEVLKALQELHVCWKKIGHYNMKCRWVAGIPGHHEGMVNNAVHNNHYFGDDSNIIENDAVSSSNVVKFEVQVIYLENHNLYYFLCHYWVVLITLQDILKVLCSHLVNSYTKLGKKSICLIFKGSRVHSFFSWIFVLLSLHSFVSSRAKSL